MFNLHIAITFLGMSFFAFCLSCLTIGLGCIAGSLLFGFLYWLEEWAR